MCGRNEVSENLPPRRKMPGFAVYRIGYGVRCPGVNEICLTGMMTCGKGSEAANSSLSRNMAEQ